MGDFMKMEINKTTQSKTLNSLKMNQSTKKTTTKEETQHTSGIIRRNSYWCMYCSSYDRGLEHLLKMWPEVKKQVPEAELHVFYGWQLFEKFYHNNPASTIFVLFI